MDYCVIAYGGLSYRRNYTTDGLTFLFGLVDHRHWINSLYFEYEYELFVASFSFHRLDLFSVTVLLIELGAYFGFLAGVGSFLSEFGAGVEGGF